MNRYIIDKKSACSTIQDMWRTIKMWWILRQLEKDCIRSEGEEIDREHTIRTSVNENLFLERLARKVVHPHIPAGKCSVCEHDFTKEADKKYGKKVAIKKAKYAAILDVCKGRGYIQQKHEHDDKHCKNWIRLEDSAHELTGVLDLFEMLLKQYKLTWTFMLVPLSPWIIKLVMSALTG